MITPLYRVKDWSELYENNRTRELKKLSWVPVPNSHDGDGYTALVCRKDGPALFGAWVVILQVASRCGNPAAGCDARGTLMRDNGVPHDAASISRMTRFPQALIQTALTLLCSPEIEWLEVVNHKTFEKIPQEGATPPQEGAMKSQASDEEGKGIEGKGIEQNRTELLTQSRVLIQLLNQQTGRHFRETSANLSIITARLKEPGVTFDGVKAMLSRQLRRWKGTAMEEYLRPETLFGKTKFDGYYAAKDLPVETNGTPTHSIPSDDPAAPLPGETQADTNRRILREAMK